MINDKGTIMINIRYFFLITFTSLSYSSTSYALWWSYAESRGEDDYITTFISPKNTEYQTQAISSKIQHRLNIHRISLFERSGLVPPYEESNLSTIIQNHLASYSNRPPYYEISLFIESGKKKQCCIAGLGKWKVLVGYSDKSCQVYELTPLSLKMNKEASQETNPLHISSENEMLYDLEDNEIVNLASNQSADIVFILLATSEFWRCCTVKNISCETIADFIQQKRDSAYLFDKDKCSSRLIYTIIKTEEPLALLAHTSLSALIVFPYDQPPA